MKKSNRELAAEIRAARKAGYKSPVPRSKASAPLADEVDPYLPVDSVIRGDGRAPRGVDLFSSSPVAPATMGE